MVKDLRISNKPVRDATHTGNIQKRYLKELYGLYLGFQSRFEPSLDRLLNRTGDTGYLREFREKLDVYSDAAIYAGAPKIIEKNTKASYIRGKDNAVNDPRLVVNSIRIPSELSRLDNLMINDLRERGFSLVTKLTEDMKTELMRVMSEDIRAGEGIPKMTRDILDAIPELTRSKAQTITRTETSYSYNTARAETYKQAGIKEWQWLSTLGERACEECIARHGEVYDWSEPVPPAHPNCLCTHRAVVDTNESE